MDPFGLAYDSIEKTATAISYEGIPDAVIGEFLPLPSMSVLDLVDFDLFVLEDTSSSVPTFSKHEPDVSLSNSLLRSNLIHPSRLALNTFLSVPAPASARSVVITAITNREILSSGRLPLSIIDVWRVLIRVHDVRGLWIASMQWLQRERDGIAVYRKLLAALAEVHQILGELPWGGIVQGFRWEGNSVGLLARYLSPSCLVTTDMEYHQEILIEKLGVLEDPHVSVLGPLFVKDLIAAHMDSTQYSECRRYRHLRSFGSRLNGEDLTHVLGTIHVNQNHWIAFVLDTVEHVLWLGDSLHHTTSNSRFPTYVYPAVNAFRWWLSVSDAMEGRNPAQYDLETLSISTQWDKSSCGVLAQNCLNHYVDPHQYPLLEDDRSILQSRLDIFRTVARRHLSSLRAQSPSVMVAGQDKFESLDIKPNADQSVEGTEPAAHDEPPFVFYDVSEEAQASQYPNVSTSTNQTTIDLPDTYMVAEQDPPKSVHMSSNTTDQASKRRKLDLRLDHTERNTGIAAFFKPISQEEYQFQTRDEYEAIQEAREHTKKQVARNASRAANEVREKDRIRKQREREVEKQSEIRDGLRSPGGTKLKKRLKPSDDGSECDSGESDGPDKQVSEASRPGRAFKETLRKPDKKKPCGRKRVNETQRASYTNWFQPFLWTMICEAGKAVGYQMRPTEIAKELQRRSPKLFANISSQWIGRQIDRTGSVPCWSQEALKHVADGNGMLGRATRLGILAPYPELVDNIKKILISLRTAKIPLSLVTARAVIVSQIQHSQPSLFIRVAKDGSIFRATDTWTRKFLKQHLRWTERRATRAAQKVPKNADALMHAALMRQALAVRDYRIPAGLRVNSDQTQVVYQQSAALTYDNIGAKQISTLGMEEKRAFTLNVGISASGKLLPFQAIFQGGTKRSLPGENYNGYSDAMKLGFRYEPSKTRTYWSTQALMRRYVDTILAPYFMDQKHLLDLSDDQECLWQLDVWSVHRSLEFRVWMWEKYPWIILDYVPGGCTGLFQPCDVGIQRILKLSIKHSQHSDAVAEFFDQLEDGVTAEEMNLDTHLATMRGRASQWLVDGAAAIDRSDIIKKAFEHCQVGKFNLSQDSLTSREVLRALGSLPVTHPELFAQLSRPRSHPSQHDAVGDGDENEAAYTETAEDDSNVPLEAVLAHITSGEAGQGWRALDGALESPETAAEGSNYDSDEVAGYEEPEPVHIEAEEGGRGKRRRKLTAKARAMLS